MYYEDCTCVCTMAIVHACTMALVHACTMAIVYACTMAIAHACTIAKEHARGKDTLNRYQGQQLVFSFYVAFDNATTSLR